MTLPPALAGYAEDFTSLSQRDRLIHLMELGKEMPSFPLEKKLPENSVSGCASLVYVDTRLVDGRLFFSGMGDSLTVNGYVALLTSAFSGYAPKEFIERSKLELEEFLKLTQLRENLIASRAEAFGNIHAFMVKQVNSLLPIHS